MDDLDKIILSAANSDWQKTAMIISKVFDSPALKGTKPEAQIIAERIYVLVDGGKLKVNGNIRRWRDSNVRLVDKTVDQARVFLNKRI